jgi:hypothetical protein
VGTFEGREVHVVEWNDAPGFSRRLEFDAATGHLVRETRKPPGEGTQVVTVYRNYAKFGAVWVATEEETTTGGRTIVLRFSAVEPNASIDAKPFTAP